MSCRVIERQQKWVREERLRDREMCELVNHYLIVCTTGEFHMHGG